MGFEGTVPVQVYSVEWQGYRARDMGMLVFYNTDPVSEIPIREVPEEYPSKVDEDPNYETMTYGLYSCKKSKVRSTFVKSKLRYLFFITKYVGANYEYMEKTLVTGYYRISKKAEVNNIHLRYLDDCSCYNSDTCKALRADDARFVSVEDAFEITPEVLEEWGVTTRLTRQSRIVLDEEKTEKLLEYLNSKEDIKESYIEETERLKPEDDEEDDDEPVENTDDEDTKEIPVVDGVEAGDDGADNGGIKESGE